MEEKKYIEEYLRRKKARIGRSMDPNKCYIMGLQTDEYLSATQEASIPFLQAHRAEYETFYKDVRQIPDGLDNLSLKEIVNQKSTLAKIYPELANLPEFSPNRLAQFEHLVLERYTVKRFEEKTLGLLKSVYKKFMEDFEQNIVPDEMRAGVNYTYSRDEREQPQYLKTLNTPKPGYKKRKRQIVGGVDYNWETPFSYTLFKRSVSLDKDDASIGLNFYLCGICNKLMIPF